jgi:hypothetical protein
MVLFQNCVWWSRPLTKRVRPSWLEVGITGHNFGRGSSKDHSTKVWLQLAQWFLMRRFLCEFPIGSYVKLSSTVVAILATSNQDGPQAKNRKKGGWHLKKISSPLKLLSQSQPNFAEMILGWSPSKIVSGIMVSDEKIFMRISHRVLC